MALPSTRESIRILEAVRYALKQEKHKFPTTVGICIWVEIVNPDMGCSPKEFMNMHFVFPVVYSRFGPYWFDPKDFDSRINMITARIKELQKELQK